MKEAWKRCAASRWSSDRAKCRACWDAAAAARLRCSTSAARWISRQPAKVEVAGKLTAGLADAELTALRRHQIGFVFQFFQLLPSLTALENV